MEILNIAETSLGSVRLPWRSSSLWWRMVLFRVYMVLFVYLQVYLRIWTTWLREPAQRFWRSSSMGWRDSSTEDTIQPVCWPCLLTLTLIIHRDLEPWIFGIRIWWQEMLSCPRIHRLAKQHFIATKLHLLTFFIRLQWQIQYFPEGNANSKDGLPTYYMAIPPQNCMKIKEIGPRLGDVPGAPWISQ